jgi:Xaa-Pro aminopeptidase
MDLNVSAPNSAKPPFDHARLDSLLERAGLDVILISSRHNLRYLMGGYSFFFFDGFEAFGTSKYFPLILYTRGKPEQTVYIGNGMEGFEQELGKFWMAEVHTKSWAVQDAIRTAADYIAKQNPKCRALGVEPDFLPLAAANLLQEFLPETKLQNAQRPLEMLRAIKRPEEIALIKQASNDVVTSMLAVMQSHGAGSTKNDLVNALIVEEEKRGLTYEYCLISAGTSLNRSPSDYVLTPGDILSLDSGGNLKGYIGDLCRMAIVGEPSQLHEDLLAEIDAIQQAARGQIKAGNPGSEIYAAAEMQIARSPHRQYVDFVTHGLGMVTHETPRLAPSGFPYAPEDAAAPLEEGMVFSVETAIKHPEIGFIKLEDTIALTSDGPQAYGDFGRGWTRCNA